MVRPLVLLVVALVSFGLVVAASADPPDPTWITGFWDDGAQDNAVLAILSIPGWVVTADLSFTNFLVTDPLPVVAQRSEGAALIVSAVESRAPPVATRHFV